MGINMSDGLKQSKNLISDQVAPVMGSGSICRLVKGRQGTRPDEDSRRRFIRLGRRAEAALAITQPDGLSQIAVPTRLAQLNHGLDGYDSAEPALVCHL